MSDRVTGAPALDLPALRDFLLAQDVAVTGELRSTVITSGRSNLTYRVDDESSSWVVRRPPTGGLTPSAHDVGREYRVIEGLQGSGVPVAPAVAFCTDLDVLGVPFAVVGFVPGSVLRTQDDLVDVDDATLLGVSGMLVDVLAGLHVVDYTACGLGDFGRPEGFFARQLKRWRQQWDLVSVRELPDLARLHALLLERVPATAGAAVVHGDYRIDNTLLDPADPTRMLALVDWEMSTLGDPLTDLATLCVYAHPAFDHVVGEPAASTSPRWPGTDDVAQAYSAKSGIDLGDFDAYLGLGYLKLAVIAEGIDARHRLGVGTGEGFATAGESVPALLSAGVAALQGSRS